MGKRVMSMSGSVSTDRYGLLSEDVDPRTGALWGNFPQAYSMAGLI